MSLKFADGSVMGLEGGRSTIQEEFNVRKYQDIAFSTPAGIRLARKVEDAWPEWVDEVANARWLRNFSRSKFFSGGGGAEAGSEAGVEGIARALYVAAVWGFGVDEWVPRYTAGTLPSKAWARSAGGLTMAAGPFPAICRLQGIRSPNLSRNWLWDGALMRGKGWYIPCEFGTLDRWLDSVALR